MGGIENERVNQKSIKIEAIFAKNLEMNNREGNIKRERERLKRRTKKQFYEISDNLNKIKEARENNRD